jgi:hypothetical protein
MPDDAIKPALRAAMRSHEIGSDSPYVISFAAKGNSGGSFGFMQGDLAAGQPIAHQTFRAAMAAAGMQQSKIDDLDRRLSVHLVQSPLTKQEEADVDAALLASRALVDAMDETILQTVYGQLDTCIAKAASADRAIAWKPQLYVALWLNMTGPPTKLLTWLGGPSGPPPALAATVGEPDIQQYLLSQTYYVQNPKNWPHMVQSVAVGAALLPQA